MRVIYVRRGEFSTYSVLIDSLIAVSDVDVRWDRRRGEDRRAKSRPIDVRAERRMEERRKPPTRDWQLHGYTVVDFPDIDSSDR
ncbi:MAG: hypothetical protein ND807_17320 [Vicinamibacterales bacterium]|nr:hypothetical protein [Vicinamibacterales bacterium]